MEYNKQKYLLQIGLIEARSIYLPNPGEILEPYFKVSFGNQIQQKRSNQLNLNPVINHVFYFPDIFLTENTFENSEIKFEIFLRNTVFGDIFIGSYSIALTCIYNSPDHELISWLSMINPQFPDKVTGHIYVKCRIFQEGDKPIDYIDFLKDENLSIMKIKEITQNFQLEISVFKVDQIIEIDKSYFSDKGNTNCFVSCRVFGITLKSDVISTENTRDFNQKFNFPCLSPILNEKIFIQVWHKRIFPTDIFIANIPTSDYFNINKHLSSQEKGKVKWINLYSIPTYERNTFFGRKKIHPENGTYFMGRILISINIYPFYDTHVIKTDLCEPCEEPQIDKYQIDFETFQFRSSDELFTSIFIDFRIGWCSSEYSQKISINELNSTYDFKFKSKIINEFPKDISQVPDIFINLYIDSGERIGFIRLKPQFIIENSSNPFMLDFKPLDLNLKSPGSILMNIQII